MPVVVPRSLAAALDALSDDPDALVVAGGTDLVVELNERHRRLTSGTVVAINRVPELRTWSLDPDASTVRIGAAVRYAEIEGEPLSDLLPALGQAARTVGSPQIRNAATIGGNLATCSPAGDGLPVLAALDASVELASRSGVRMLPVSEFMVGVKRTARLPGELITAVHVPLLDGWQGYAKVGVRNAMVIAIAGVCLAVDRPTRSVRVALGSVAPTIVRATAAEHYVADHIDWATGTIDAEAAGRFAELVVEASRPIDDHRATAAYRRHAVGVLARRQLARAFALDEGAAA